MGGVLRQVRGLVCMPGEPEGRGTPPCLARWLWGGGAAAGRPSRWLPAGLRAAAAALRPVAALRTAGEGPGAPPLVGPEGGRGAGETAAPRKLLIPRMTFLSGLSWSEDAALPGCLHGSQSGSVISERKPGIPSLPLTHGRFCPVEEGVLR